MTLLTFFGCALTAYGPALSIFFLHVARDAQLVLLMVSRRAKYGLNLVSKNPNSPYNEHSFAFVCGLGYGLINGSITYVTLLVYSIGPGILMCKSCPFLSLYFVGAITTCLFILLHITWMMTAFEGFSNPKRKFSYILFTMLSHFGASYTTLLNESTIEFGCIYSLMINLTLLISSVLIMSLALKKVVKE
ncbi:5852_t:CDS:2 [Entrophospora sp. SA101]|nr:5852_t:CDS:2 [Entrophospora sp. SA101]